MSNRLWILAGNYAQAKGYARENNIRPNDWDYLLNADRLRGYRNIRLVRVGTWHERRDLGRLELELKFMGYTEESL